MLSRWFDRSGIGQILAPDDNFAKFPVEDEATSPIWQFLAPDPNFAPPKAPPPDAFPPGTKDQVLCQHCGEWTSTASTTDYNNKTPTKSASSTVEKTVPTPFTTPSPPVVVAGGVNDTADLRTPSRSTISGNNSTLDFLVLSAAKDTVVAMNSPPPRQKLFDKVFRLCSSKKLDDNLVKRLRNHLIKDPSLLRSRATCLGQLVPDGLTPLMAAAYAGQLKAAQVILEVAAANNTTTDKSVTILMDRDYQGRTALHIAAEQGHVDIVTFLLPKYQLGALDATTESKPTAAQLMSSPPPLDLLGRTPLGRAITSPNPAARSRRKELEAKLFGPGDLSVFGVCAPESERTSTDPALRLAYGSSDMPGMRVTMEDAVCISRFEHQGKPYWLLGVCDGHSDQGQVSNFVASHIPSILQTNMTTIGAANNAWENVWKDTCLQLDSNLRQEGISGGSTGVFCLISTDEIVVANVGDSRAILIRSSAPSATSTTSTSTSTGLENQMQQMAISESTSVSEQGYPTPIDGDQTVQQQNAVEPSNNGPVVIALSEDHKPELVQEKARIENAGLQVTPFSFEENGKEITIHKIVKSANDTMAVSRAFGDFEYKANSTMSQEDQAVTAVPDVRVHKRDAANDMYLILACDGVWDVCDNDMVKDFVLHQVQARREISDTVLPEVGDALLRESLNRGSRDNMTTIVVALDNEVNALLPSIKGKTLDFASPQKVTGK